MKATHGGQFAVTGVSPRSSFAAPSHGKPNFFKSLLSMNPLKLIFAMGYILQGLANPFEGITYQSFFKHFRYDYGISESGVQNLYSQTYLAWSFKPLIGFLMDAYGRTKATLIILLLLSTGFYITTPLVDSSSRIFFCLIFVLSIIFASTDVAVDRATVILGDEESKNTGRSRAATVGLNQAICWAAIYITCIFASVTGGWVAENIKIKYLMLSLALLHLAAFLLVLRLPKDTARAIPIKESIKNFWDALNTGPIIWVILFYFFFWFRPALGPLWLNHLIEDLHFSQVQIGYADAASNFGYFVGVLVFVWIGIPWQDKLGMRNIFRIFIILNILVNMTQCLLVDPWFGKLIRFAHNVLPWHSLDAIRFLYLAGYNFFYALLDSVISMSTLSLVGAVIPVYAAGSLFAGFMSVSNLASAFSYSSGSWLYDNGLKYGFFRFLQKELLGIASSGGDKMALSLLIFLGPLTTLISFLVVHILPDRKQTLGVDNNPNLIGPKEFKVLGESFLRIVNIVSLISGITIFLLIFLGCSEDIIKSSLIAFFTTTFLRKVFLDWCYKRFIKKTSIALLA